MKAHLFLYGEMKSLFIYFFQHYPTTGFCGTLFCVGGEVGVTRLSGEFATFFRGKKDVKCPFGGTVRCGDMNHFIM